MMTLQLISITRSSTKEPGQKSSASAGAAAMEISDPFTQRESEALIKGSALHLHPPGVIYRTRGKMNGRIKMASRPDGDQNSEKDDGDV